MNKIEFPIVTICSLDFINSESLSSDIFQQFNMNYPPFEYKTISLVKLNDLYNTNQMTQIKLKKLRNKKKKHTAVRKYKVK